MRDSKQVTKQAIEFAGPERVPIECLAMPERSDIVLVGSAPQYWVWKEVSPGIEECVDENGCVRRRLEGKTNGEVFISPLEDWDNLDSFAFSPTPESWSGDTRCQIDRYADNYIMGDLGIALYTVVDLRKMENFLYDVAAEPDLLARLLDKVLDRKLARVRAYASLGVDAVAWYDDWGIQDRLLISPASWRSLFKSAYASIIEEAHRHGLHTYWHSCGYIWDILPDMVEIGVDVINLQQPNILGIDRLAESFGGKVCFCCPVDIQTTLPMGDMALAEREAHELIDKLASYSGGFIGMEFDRSDDLGLRPEVLQAYSTVFRSFRSEK